MTASAWRGAALAALGVGLVVLGGHNSPQSDEAGSDVTTGLPPQGTGGSDWWTLVLIAGVVVAVLGILAVAAWREHEQLVRHPNDRRLRIDALTASLKQSLRSIDLIRQEVEDGERLLSELEARIAAHRQVATLTESESAAVREVLRGELRTESRRGLWVDVALGMLFFLLGVGFTLYLRP